MKFIRLEKDFEKCLAYNKYSISLGSNSYISLIPRCVFFFFCCVASLNFACDSWWIVLYNHSPPGSRCDRVILAHVNLGIASMLSWFQLHDTHG